MGTKNLPVSIQRDQVDQQFRLILHGRRLFFITNAHWSIIPGKLAWEFILKMEMPANENSKKNILEISTIWNHIKRYENVLLW